MIYSEQYLNILSSYNEKTFGDWKIQTRSWKEEIFGEVAEMRKIPTEDRLVLAQTYYNNALEVGTTSPKYKSLARLSILANLSDDILDTILDAARVNYRLMEKKIGWDTREEAQDGGKQK